MGAVDDNNACCVPIERLLYIESTINMSSFVFINLKMVTIKLSDTVSYFKLLIVETFDLLYNSEFS